MAKERSVPGLDFAGESPAKLPRLEEDCPHCQGTGEIPNPDFALWRMRLAEWEGSGRQGQKPSPPFSPESSPCRHCHFSGKVPSAAGAELLAFLKRNRIGA